ncbi:MAG TPA: hypothetical protein VK390_07540 [Propionibacteriaceae bacterium]|nr:hypothetical protein [Propionibacteriaceae bacterium]
MADPDRPKRDFRSGLFVMLLRVRRRRVLKYVVLALLVALNLFLIGMLLWPRAIAEPATQRNAVPSTAPSASPVGGATATPTHSRSAKPSRPETPSPMATPATKEDLEVIPTKRLLVAQTASEAWRATVGDCKTPGRIERSTNRGKSWKRVARTNLAPIVGLGIEGKGNLYAVGGTGPKCSTRYIAYSRSGAVRGQTNAPQGVWFLEPGNSDRVIGPGNTKATPCRTQHIISLAALDDSRALLVCTEGSVAATSNAGRSWKKVGNLPGTMAVTAAGSRYWAAGSAKACDGVVVKSVGVEGDHLSTGRSRCVTNTEVSAGRVALGAGGNAIWLWAGDKLRISTNGGQSWI